MNDGDGFICSARLKTGAFLITIMEGFDLPMTENFPAPLGMKGIKEQRMEDRWRYVFCPDFWCM